MAVFFSLSALLGIAKLTMQVYGNSRQEMVWLPSLGGALVLMIVAALDASRALRVARPLAKDGLKSATEVGAAAAKKAFEKVRVYFFCAALVTLVTWTLAAFMR
jgi:hypothetical protein